MRLTIPESLVVYVIQRSHYDLHCLPEKRLSSWLNCPLHPCSDVAMYIRQHRRKARRRSHRRS